MKVVSLHNFSILIEKGKTYDVIKSHCSIENCTQREQCNKILYQYSCYVFCSKYFKVDREEKLKRILK